MRRGRGPASTRRPTCWPSTASVGRRAGQDRRRATSPRPPGRRSRATAPSSRSPPTSGRWPTPAPRVARGADGVRPGAHRVPLPGSRPRARRRRSRSRSTRAIADGAGRSAGHRADARRRRRQAAALPPDAAPRRTRSSGCAGIRLAWTVPTCSSSSWARCAGTRGGPPTGVMFPMVSTVDELVAARELLAEAAGDGGVPRGLAGRDDGRGAGGGPEDRVVPAVPRLRQHRDQRPDPVHAGGRARERRGRALSDALDPAVLQLVATGSAGRAPGVRRSRCAARSASDAVAVPVLIGLGVAGAERRAAVGSRREAGRPRARHARLHRPGGACVGGADRCRGQDTGGRRAGAAGRRRQLTRRHPAGARMPSW